MTQRPATYCPDCGTKVVRRTFEGRERRYCPDCERFVWQNAIPGAGVAVVRENEVLLVRRRVAPDVGLWTVPGGHLEFDEPPREGAVRELEEETDIVATPDDLVLSDTRLLESWKEGGEYIVSIGYAVPAELTDGNPEAGSDADAARFWHPDALVGAGERLRPHDAERIKRAFEAIDRRE